jgi:hypothetical protein
MRTEGVWTLTALLAWYPSGLEMVVLIILGVLLFGKRLPELGRTLGEGFSELSREAHIQHLINYLFAVLVIIALALIALLWLRPG